MRDLVDRARAALDGVTTGPWDVRGQKTVGTGVRTLCKTTWQNGKNDACFIAAARQLVPEMADRIEALEAALREIAELPDVDADHRSVIARNALEGRTTNA